MDSSTAWRTDKGLAFIMDSTMTSNIQNIGPSDNVHNFHVSSRQQSKDNGLQMKFKVSPKLNNLSNLYGYVISETVMFRLSISEVPESQGNHYWFHVKFSKMRSAKDNPNCAVKYTHKYEDLKAINKHFNPVDDTWHLIQTYTKDKDKLFIGTFDISVTLCDANVRKPDRIERWQFYYDDTAFTDFELRGYDGSIYMHKIIAAAASPVFNTMLLGKWRETEEGIVNLPDISQETLQQLKDYIYLDELPDTDLEELLILATYYMMSDLELRCVNALVTNVTPEKAHNMIEFAVQYDVQRLLQGILKRVQNGTLLLDKIPEFVDLDYN